MRLVGDKKAEPRKTRRLAVALVECQERAPDNRDRDLPVKLLTRRGAPLPPARTNRQATAQRQLAIHQTLIMPLASTCG